MDAKLAVKNVNFFNLTTTNAIVLKLATILYLHKIIHLAKNWSVKLEL